MYSVLNKKCDLRNKHTYFMFRRLEGLGQYDQVAGIQNT